MGDKQFSVSSWSCTFDKRRGVTRVLDVRFDHRKPDHINLSVYLEAEAREAAKADRAAA